MAVYVIGKHGEKLAPCTRPGRVRHLLKEGKAIIFKHHPFTIQLMYDTSECTLNLEIGVDSRYGHVGISVKSERKEYVSAEYELLKDEKQRHDDQRKYRRTRRNRLRYRKARWQNRKKKEGWIAPSLQHKADTQIKLIKDTYAVAPVSKITIEIGQFDPAYLKAMELGEELPSGADYQHGPMYMQDSVRAAVLQRDNYKCQVCGRSGIGKDAAVLKLHHALYYKGRHGNSINELLTVCDRCHTSANHEKGGKLYGLVPKAARLEGAAFMNTVRWYIYNTLKKELPDTDISFTYGSITSRKRKDAQLDKTHASDAYCIGDFMPKKRADTECFQKRRRNNRCLEFFYDAKIIDIRTGKTVSGKELGCERTNRSQSRTSSNSLRKYRGAKISKGRRSIRRSHYPIQPGDKIAFGGNIYKVIGTQNKGKYIAVRGRTPVAVSKTKIIQHGGAWMRKDAPVS